MKTEGPGRRLLIIQERNDGPGGNYGGTEK